MPSASPHTHTHTTQTQRLGFSAFVDARALGWAWISCLGCPHSARDNRLAYLIATAIIILFFFLFFYLSSDSFLLLWTAKEEEGKKECWIWMPTSCCIEAPRRQRSSGFFSVFFFFCFLVLFSSSSTISIKITFRRLQNRKRGPLKLGRFPSSVGAIAAATILYSGFGTKTLVYTTIILWEKKRSCVCVCVYEWKCFLCYSWLLRSVASRFNS